MNTFNNYFNWDFEQLVVMLLPPLLRKSKMIAFVTMLADGTNKVYQQLVQFRIKSKYDAFFSQSRITFEHYLNDEFDNIGRSIRIVNADFLERTHIYKHIENRELRIYKQSENKPNPKLYKIQEFDTSLHFIIQIPVTLNLSIIQVKALRLWVDNHKLPNKNYIIQNI